MLGVECPVRLVDELVMVDRRAALQRQRVVEAHPLWLDYANRR